MSEIAPASKSYERNLIACALNSPELLEMLDLPVPSFECDELRIVYSMIHDLKATGHQEITIDTLRMFYDSRSDFYGLVKEHGGYKFLEALNSRPDFVNFPLHLEGVTQRYDIRVARARATSALEELTSKEFTNPDQVYDVLDGIMDCSASPDTDIFRGLSLGWLDEQEGRFARGEFKTPGIPITNRAMKEAFGNFWYCGSLVMWAGETGVGKSQIVQMLIRQGFDDGVPTLILDNEMEATQFRDRYIASVTGIPLLELVTGKAFNPKGEYAKDIRGYVSKTKDQAHLVEWRKLLDMRMERIEPIVRRWMRKFPTKDYPFKQVIVDGIKMSADSDNLFAIGYLAQRLKEFAGKHSTDGLVIHATCQLQRPPKQTIKDKASNPPDHNSIGLSKLISDNAAVVAVIVKEPLVDFSGWDATRRRIFVPKHRFHQTLETNSYLSCEFDGKCSYLNPLLVVQPNGGREADTAPMVAKGAFGEDF